MSPVSTILIVDDEPNVRLVFRATLESAGYLVVEASDGEEALAALAGARSDLVLLDLQMPRLDGMGTLRRLRDLGAEVPVVIVTAHGSIPDAVEAMRLGAIDFLTKPLKPDALRAAVADVLGRHSARQPATAVPVVAGPPEADPTTGGESASQLSRAKKALNARHFEEAEVHLRRAIALRPDSADAHNLMGVLHEVRNEQDASCREYRAALKADGDHVAARHNMMRYYERYTFGRSDLQIDAGD